MIVGVMRVELSIGEASSLKDKRRVVKSIVDRFRARYNIAIAEVDNQDSWQRVTLGLACVSTDGRHANEMLSCIARDLERDREATLLDYTVEIV
ncbi:MAG TPA: DUF503 domain-containing protein [Firmicutes bacterium]|nr:DUF503 domain-containing protein [Bacillota bacterium]